MPRKAKMNPQIQRHAAEKQDDLNKAAFLGEKGIVAEGFHAKRGRDEGSSLRGDRAIRDASHRGKN